MPAAPDRTPDPGNPFEDPTARRDHLDHDNRLRTLSATDQDMIRLATMPGFHRWLQQIHHTAGCTHPIYLAGHSTTIDTSTGQVLHHYSTAEEPGGRLAIRCRNRRATRCAPCSREHQGDTYHLVRAGLVGGKGLPSTVRTHPRLFVTLTAPSFGPVHRTAETCHGVRRGTCPHGAPHGCGRVHVEGDPLIGQPLCPHCYDYTAHVLWNAHAPALWKAFGDNLYHHLATQAGVSRTAIRKQVRVSAAKVAEYQKRGAIHFHAVIRLDGPDGPDTPPPVWATPDLLTDAVQSAAAAVALRVPDSSAFGERRLGFGTQLDIHALSAGDGGRISDEAVAAYVAKYTTKSVEEAGALDRRITRASEIRTLRVTDHVRALIGTAWRLGGLPELEHLRLRMWAHMLGYRGHCLTKTRTYSTTYTALRAVRAGHVRAATGRELFSDWDDGTTTESAWRYLCSGHTLAEAMLAAGIAEDIAMNRQAAREQVGDQWPRAVDD
ncbi:replication initiator [Streptacidiphilus sp. PAMC 29251]